MAISLNKPQDIFIENSDAAAEELVRDGASGPDFTDVTGIPFYNNLSSDDKKSVREDYSSQSIVIAKSFSSDWENPTMQTGWTSSNFGYSMRGDGFVTLKGKAIFGMGATANVALLPSDLAPTHEWVFVCMSSAGPVEVTVQSSGMITTTAASGWVSLAGVCYRVS